MKVLLIISLAIVFAFILLVCISCMVVSSRCSREEEKRYSLVYTEKGNKQ